MSTDPPKLGRRRARPVKSSTLSAAVAPAMFRAVRRAAAAQNVSVSSWIEEACSRAMGDPAGVPGLEDAILGCRVLLRFLEAQRVRE